jgi:hypothetical protein
MYFLSRPRRFGKSLLISTLRAIFRGERELFQGLWIDRSDYTWEQYPVIWLDMSNVVSTSTDLLQQTLNEQLDLIAGQYGVELASSLTIFGRLNKLITELAKDKKRRYSWRMNTIARSLIKSIVPK